MPFVSVVIVAIVTAYISYPIYAFLRTKNVHAWLCVAVTRLVILITVIVPMWLLVWLLTWELTTIYNDLLARNDLQQITTTIEQTLRTVSFDSIDVDISNLQQQILSVAQEVVSWASSLTASIGGSILRTATSLVLFIFLTSGLLLNWPRVVAYLTRKIPLQSQTVTMYLQRLGLMTQWIIASTFVIAVLQGLVTALSLWIVGVPYFVFFMTLATVLSIIPMLGAAVIAITVGIVLMLSGNIRWGIVVIAVNQIIVNNIDNILRPKLITEEARINDTLFILSMFCGLSYRWVGGILLGPLAMSFVITTLEISKKKLPGVE